MVVKVISVANQKGGVGKTTTTVNLTACVGAMGNKVLLIDLDPQGNATSGLGINKKDLKQTIYTLLVDGGVASDCIIHTEFDNIDVLAANIDLVGAELELVGRENREFALKGIVEEIKDNYDYIFIDCPPSLGLLTINALVASDGVIVPLQCEYYALEGLSQLTNTINQVKRLLNPTLEICGIVLTMFDKRTKLSQQVVDDVKKYFPGRVFNGVIPRNIRLSEAPSFGKPIIFYDKWSKGALSYTKLAKEFIKKVGGKK